MKFAQDTNASDYVITAYEAGAIRVNGKAFQQSLIIAPRQLRENWQIDSITQLHDRHIRELIAMKPELILVGTGDRLMFPAVEIYAACIHHNIGIDFMDTGAACRTYNILTSEDRNVVAGLIIPAPPANGDATI